MRVARAKAEAVDGEEGDAPISLPPELAYNFVRLGFDLTPSYIGSPHDDVGVGIAGAQLLEEAPVGRLVVTMQLSAGLPGLAEVERGGEVVGSKGDDENLRLPGGIAVLMLLREEHVGVGLGQGVDGRAAVVADHAAAGDGVDLIVGVIVTGDDGTEGLGVVGVGPDLLMGTDGGGREVSIADGVGVTDELDLPATLRRGERLLAEGNGKAAEDVGGGLGFCGDKDGDGVLAGAEAFHLIRTGCGLDQWRGGLAVDDDVQDLVALHDSEIHLGSLESRAEIDAGPLIGVILGPEAVGGKRRRGQHASANGHRQGAKGGEGGNFVHLQRGCVCGDAQERNTNKREEKLLGSTAHFFMHWIHYKSGKHRG